MLIPPSYSDSNQKPDQSNSQVGLPRSGVIFSYPYAYVKRHPGGPKFVRTDRIPSESPNNQRDSIARQSVSASLQNDNIIKADPKPIEPFIPVPVAIPSAIPVITPSMASQPPIIRTRRSFDRFNRWIGFSLIVICLTGFLSAASPFIRLEIYSRIDNFKAGIKNAISHKITQARASVGIVFPTPTPASDANPLVDQMGNPIEPINRDFALIIPKIGVNAPIIASVNPVNTAGYTDALSKGVAHASTSYYPNENGTVYLFSHSTNYEWFIKDLNAVFYLVKNLEPGDKVVIMYLGDRYTYKIREKKVVGSGEVAYLKPQQGAQNLILQTCWPPGSSWQRLLIFADLIEVKKT